MRSVVATTHYTATILVTRNNLLFLLCCYSSYCGFFLLHCYCFTCCLRQINVFNDLYTWWKTQSEVLLQSCIGKISLSFDKWLKYGEFQLRIWNRCQRITSECAVSANELGACALLGSCRFKICICICGVNHQGDKFTSNKQTDIFTHIPTQLCYYYYYYKMYWLEWCCHRKLLQGHLTIKKEKEKLSPQ